MKAALIVIAVWMSSCAVLEGADRGFDDIVRAISNQFHTRPLHIPFFGLVNFASFVGDHPASDLAEVVRMADLGWRPFVRVQGHAKTVLVYIAEERAACRVLVLTVESGEVMVVELKLNPETIQAWLREPDAEAARNVSR